MTQKASKKPRKKKQAVISDSPVLVADEPSKPTPAPARPQPIPNPRDLFPHALHKQIMELKVRVEILEAALDSIKDKK